MKFRFFNRLCVSINCLVAKQHQYISHIGVKYQHILAPHITMNGPPKKKFKQSTLFECFKRTSSLDQSFGSEYTPTVKEGKDKVAGKERVAAGKKKVKTIMPQNETEQQKQERLKRLEAAEKRENSEKKLKVTDVEAEEQKEKVDDGKNEKMEDDKRDGKVVEENKMKDNTPDEKSEQKITDEDNEEIPANSKMMNAPETEAADTVATCATELDMQPTSGPDSQQTEPDSQQSQFENSEDLFSDSENLYSLNEPEEEEEKSWKGVRREDLLAAPDCCLPLPDLRPSKLHTVLVNTGQSGLSSARPPPPHPRRYQDAWDATHVRLPCSKENLYPLGNTAVERWPLIREALQKPIRSSFELEKAILSYNSRQAGSWNFASLHSLLNEELSEAETEAIFSHTLPAMVNLALDLPNVVTQPVPLLVADVPHKVTLSQHQAACLLANAFFCTFPRRNTRKRSAEYSNYPDINFNTLFMGASYGRKSRKVEKLKCIFEYFRQVTTDMPPGCLTFSRQLVRDFPRWSTSHAELPRLHVAARGTIEDDGVGMLQVDFANKYIGGGALNTGLVQEEIRFLVCPELILTRLFTECLADHECLLVTGAQTYSRYTGYSDSFRWEGGYTDVTPRDRWGRRHCEIVAIDALVFRDHDKQFEARFVKRELEKAYCGFNYVLEQPGVKEAVKRDHTPAVATGNWGCGAFGGDHRLKALLQLMAAAEAGRDVCFFTFGDRRLRDDLHNIHTLLTDKKQTVGDVWRLIQDYHMHVLRPRRRAEQTLYEFISSVLLGADDVSSDSDSDNAGSDAGRRQQPYDSPNYAANTP